MRINVYLDISLFAHFQRAVKIYDQCTHAQIVIKKNLVIKVLRCIFWESNFEKHLCSEMHFSIVLEFIIAD